MRVTQLIARHVRIPFKRAFRHASHSRTDTDNIVVSCMLGSGNDSVTGHGESVPREYVTGETIDSAMDLLARSDLPAQLETCSDFAAAVALAERLRLAPIPGDDRQCQGNAARCAVELALLDAYGQLFREPLSAVVPQVAPELHEPKPRVQYSAALTTGSTGFKLRLRVWGLWLYGFKQIKVKVGIAGHDDVARLRAIRRRAGRKMDLRVDANEAWPAAEAAQRILALKPFDVSAVEQPVRHEEVAALAEIRKQTGVPIMLDESLCSMIDAERAVKEATCDIFNIRLSKCGGFIPSLRIAQFARRNGLLCQLGCQVGETGLLSAAGRHFACSVGALRYLEGSYDRHLVRRPLTVEDLTFGWGGRAPALTRPGLGVQVDAAQLVEQTIRSHPLM
jgi:muconate cycloisomerase